MSNYKEETDLVYLVQLLEENFNYQNIVEISCWGDFKGWAV